MYVRVRAATFIWKYRNCILYYLCNQVSHYPHYIPFLLSRQPGTDVATF